METTAIGRAVLTNRAQIELLGLIFLRAINDKLESLREARDNSDEAAAEIAEYENLKARIEAFLNRTSEFAGKQATEESTVAAAMSFADGINDWWLKQHVKICDRVFDSGMNAFSMALFGAGVGICVQAGVSNALGAALSLVIPGVIAGGDRVVEAIKAIRSGSDKKKDD